MFLRCTRRKKDGKLHEYWSVVENRRLSDGRVVQRQVLYLGEINASQREAWRKTIEVQEATGRRQVALFPAGSMPADDVDAIGVRLSELRLQRPRQWGACWLALNLWQQLDLDAFWQPRLRPSREGTPWLKVLKTLVAYRLIDPGSEWRLHRQWFDASAMAAARRCAVARARRGRPRRRSPAGAPATPKSPAAGAGCVPAPRRGRAPAWPRRGTGCPPASPPRCGR